MSYKTETDIENGLSLKKPKMYAVIMHNDDYTTMDFVVDILVKIFKKTLADATAIMIDVHNKGSAVVAVYTYDIAATKTAQATAIASDRGYPFLLTIKEALE